MNADRAAETLRYLLTGGNRPSGRAVLLTGGWGSGKTFLWNNMVVPTLDRPSLYVSAFGAESPAAFKTRLLSGIVHGAVSRTGVDKSRKVREVGDKIKQSMGRSGTGIMSILSSVGNSLLKRVDVDPLQLFEFLDAQTVICIDDIERISPQFATQDLLAMSNFLTEHRRFDVVLVSNEEQIGNGDTRVRDAYLRYKEKTVHREVHLEADIPSIFERVLCSAIGSVTAQAEIRNGRETVLETFGRAKEENIRVLGRLFTSLELLASFGVTKLSVEHLRLLSSFTILSAKGGLESPEFYAFEPLEVRIAAHMRRRQEQREELQKRTDFLERFFGDNEYSFDKKIYQLALQGEVDDAHFRQLSTPRPSQSKEEATYQKVVNGDWRYWSDAQVRDLLGETENVLRSDHKLDWRAALKLLAYSRFLAKIIRTELPSDLGPTVAENVEKRILEAKREDLVPYDRAWELHMQDLGDLVKEETAVVKKALSLAERGAYRKVLVASIDGRDVASFLKLLQQDLTAAGDVLFDDGCLERIWDARKGAAQFFLAAVEALLHELNSWAHTNATISARRDVVLARLKLAAEDSSEGHMDRWRFSTLVKSG